MMQKILLATHGHLASGLLSTLKIIAGDVSRVQAIDGYTEAEDITSAIENTLDSLMDSDQLIVFTDLFGGSINQLVTKLVMEKNIPAIIVSGFNVALVLAVLLANKPINKQQMQLYIDEARKGMTMVELKSTQSNDSENDFFG
ncbi:PTS sugar transporter subunit IIA [Lacticaseibacillus paracasei]|uniref:PTS mannose transporter subunit IIA n=1 Tax=Lacticaseibacillus paracasei TaxID=1597 RepID=A0ABD7BWY3_LACPA|nr:PTS mannose transporter subunit IIA [Lacticaseibacillus paracasei]QOP57203.1 PTS mannose transporter subunit IIA [Lacticaseibacillus paracasei]